MRTYRYSALLLFLAACHHTNRSVYDQPIPERNDAQALLLIRDQLRPEDRSAWQDIDKRITDPRAERIQSKTVGEAIRRWWAQHECMTAHAKGQETAGDNVQTRDREIAAFTDCLEMTI